MVPLTCPAGDISPLGISAYVDQFTGTGCVDLACESQRVLGRIVLTGGDTAILLGSLMLINAHLHTGVDHQGSPDDASIALRIYPSALESLCLLARQTDRKIGIALDFVALRIEPLTSELKIPEGVQKLAETGTTILFMNDCSQGMAMTSRDRKMVGAIRAGDEKSKALMASCLTYLDLTLIHIGRL